jgi:demethylmenaquinone methyltransferase / 2-methoxy-6-polyprenyl-1,4-benzoquinol methylase
MIKKKYLLTVFFLHWPGLRVFFPKDIKVFPKKESLIAALITLLICSGTYVLSQSVEFTLVIWGASHIVWGGFLVFWFINYESNSYIGVKKTFGNISKRYDFINDLISFGMHRLWKKLSVKYLAIKDHDKILDIATGTGDLAFLLAKKYSNSQVIGLDPSKEMLSVAKKKLDHQPFLTKNIKFIEGKMEELPFSSDSFDKIIIAFGVRNATDLNKGLAEISRVLKKEGTIVILEFSVDNKYPLHFLSKIYIQFFIPAIAFLFQFQDEYSYLSRTIFEFPRPKEFQEILSNHHFSLEKRVNLALGSCQIFVCKKLTP